MEKYIALVFMLSLYFYYWMFAQAVFVFLKKEGLGYPVINEIPGQDFTGVLLSIYIKIRIDIDLFHGPRPISLIVMDGKQNRSDAPVAKR